MIIKIFISYSNVDRAKMISLRKRIEMHNSLKAIVVADERKASKLLTEKVKDGIKACDYFVCILTEESILNQWVNQEIGFATALDKSIRPIVASGILDKLKGFIHKQMDLPYSVSSNYMSSRSQSILFSKRAKDLVSDLMFENLLLPKEVDLESFFPGLWECEFILAGKRGIDPKVDISSNAYYSNGELQFILDDFKVDLKKQTLSFIKRDPKDKRLVARNELRIIKLNERYEGFENSTTPIAYYRVGSATDDHDTLAPEKTLSKNQDRVILNLNHIKALAKSSHVFTE